MEKEFKSLSEKIFIVRSGDLVGTKVAFSDDIKEFIKIIKEDNAEGIRMIIKMYPHKSGEELASEIIEYLNNKVMWRRAGDKLI